VANWVAAARADGVRKGPAVRPADVVPKDPAVRPADVVPKDPAVRAGEKDLWELDRVDQTGSYRAQYTPVCCDRFVTRGQEVLPPKALPVLLRTDVAR
jgi:hypothetical protein